MVLVSLSMTDLSYGINKLFGLPPIIHSSVIVGDRRVEFGPSGITVSLSKSEKIKEEIYDLGETYLPLDTLMNYLSFLNKTKFKGKNYSLLKFNCNTFAKFLIKELLGIDLGEYLDKLPQTILEQVKTKFLSAFLAEFVVKTSTCLSKNLVN